MGGLRAQDASPVASPTAGAPIEVAMIDVDGAEAGTATFTEGDDGMVTVAIEVSGLSEGDHGIHVHAMGMCDPALLEPFSSAGPHYNPTGDMHGALGEDDAHGGDLNNLTADADGNASAEIMTDGFTLSDGPTSVFDADGSAIVVHQAADDLTSQPSGASGGRVLCGVVAEPMMTQQPAASPVTGSTLNAQQVPFSEDLLSQLQLPEGFEISVYAQGLANPRIMAVGPDGKTVYVTEPESNQVTALLDTDGDGVIDDVLVATANLKLVHGIAFDGDTVYLAGEKEVWTGTVNDDGTFGDISAIVADLPDGDQHGRRTIALGPDGMLYVSLGSSCNACRETNPENATIIRMNPDGSDREIFASGLRNTLGWGWEPTTGLMWGMDMGADWRGNDTPPDELNQITAGGNYGWPYCYADQQIEQNIPYSPPGSTADQYCANSQASVLDYQAHSAPIGMVFLSGSQFPEEYQGDALVTFRGSWNRDPVVGYKVVRIDFDESGQPVSAEDFITGWLMEDGMSQFGRIAGLTLLPDGSLLISEDSNGVIYRVTYTGA